MQHRVDHEKLQKELSKWEQSDSWRETRLLFSVFECVLELHAESFSVLENMQNKEFWHSDCQCLCFL